MIEKFSTLGTVLFALAVLHTFSVKQFQKLAQRYPEGSVKENLFHLLGEVEVVFGLWATLLVCLLFAMASRHETVFFLETLNFTEPLFVFVIMAMASTKPVIELATYVVSKVAKVIPLKESLAFYFSALVVGPLLGSLITEPAAMTVTALILKNRFFDKGPPENFKYLTLAVLFVNVSVGGVLTHFAAPPVLMVAPIWGWGTDYMFEHFGWKAMIGVFVNAVLAVIFLASDLKKIPNGETRRIRSPLWLTIVHLLFLALVVFNAHHAVVFIGLFLLFLGLASVTKEYQDPLKLRESFLVAFFLAGLVVLGAFQSGWLKPLLASLSEFPLFVGATILTGFVDNAALTYLGAQVQGLSEAMKYALVAGAVSGGGLTVIANAPNPAGFSILGSSFSGGGISPLKLFLYAVVPTLVVTTVFWCL